MTTSTHFSGGAAVPTLLRRTRLFVTGHVALSALAVLAVVLLHSSPAIVNDAVWVRTCAVLATALLLLAFTVRAAAGSRGAYVRLRISGSVMLLAILAIVVLPGELPPWLRVEQAVCGLLVAAALVTAFDRRLRTAFAKAG